MDTGADRIIGFRNGEASLIAGAPYPVGFTGGDNGPATRALLGNTKRVFCAVDGSIFLTQGSQVRQVGADGIIRLVGDGFEDPFGVLADSAGRLVIAESSAHRVTRYDIAGRSRTVVAGTGRAGFSGDGGNATDAQLNSPADLAFDSSGALLIADRNNRRVRRLRSDGKIETVAGSAREFSHSDITGERANDTGFDRITGLAADSLGNLYLAESNRLCWIGTDGRVTVLAGYAGEDDAGVKTNRVRGLTGVDALSAGPHGELHVSVRQDGAVFSIERR